MSIKLLPVSNTSTYVRAAFWDRYLKRSSLTIPLETPEEFDRIARVETTPRQFAETDRNRRGNLIATHLHQGIHLGACPIPSMTELRLTMAGRT